MPPELRDLLANEAIDLAYALSAHASAANGIRLLAIKGIANTFHKLRPPRTPNDVDVLVEPDRHAEFIEILERRGWQSHGEIADPHAFAGHAVMMHHELWPRTIDVHRYFPGFLESPAAVFDRLWQSRIATSAAGREVLIPGRAASILILALHSKRASGRFRANRELSGLIQDSENLTGEDRAELAELAVATGANWTLRDVLRKLKVSLEPLSPDSEPALLKEWEVLVSSGFAPADVWLSKFASSNWKSRPAVLWRAIWPSSHDLRVAHPETGRGRRGEFVARIRRWGRGIKAAPRALRDRRRR
ncbi:MAG: nucleotidyltransferase family protein [Microbacteriaceae bacterium]|nr:nucleotidyltransferase family protein [Microbacteriaceae bacterium]